jgi:hypothetical protein
LYLGWSHAPPRLFVHYLTPIAYFSAKSDL